MKPRIEQGLEGKIKLLNEQIAGNFIDESKVEIAKVAKVWAELLRLLESDEENGVTIKRFSIDGCLSYIKGTSNSQPSFSVLVGYEDSKIDLLHNYILSRNTTEDDIKTHIKEVFGISADKSASGVHEDNCAGNPIVGEEKERVTKGGPKAIDFRKSFSRAIGCEEKGKEGNLPITITKNEEGDRFIDSAPPKNGCIVLKGKAPTVDISLPEIEEIEEDGYVIEHPENDLVLTIRILAAPFRVDRFCISRPSTPEGQAGKLLYEDSDIIESYAKDGKKNIGEKTIEEIKDKVASIKFSVRGEDVDIKMQPEVANIDEVYKEIIAEQAKKHQMELEEEDRRHQMELQTTKSRGELNSFDRKELQETIKTLRDTIELNQYDMLRVENIYNKGQLKIKELNDLIEVLAEENADLKDALDQKVLEANSEREDTEKEITTKIDEITKEYKTTLAEKQAELSKVKKELLEFKEQNKKLLVLSDRFEHKYRVQLKLTEDAWHDRSEISDELEGLKELREADIQQHGEREKKMEEREKKIEEREQKILILEIDQLEQSAKTAESEEREAQLEKDLAEQKEREAQLEKKLIEQRERTAQLEKDLLERNKVTTSLLKLLEKDRPPSADRKDKFNSPSKKPPPYMSLLPTRKGNNIPQSLLKLTDLANAKRSEMSNPNSHHR